MSKRAASWLAGSLVGVSVVCFVATLLISARIPADKLGKQSILWPFGPTDLAMLAYAAIGALIATRRPENSIGWIFLTIGFSYLVGALAIAYVAYSAQVPSHATYTPSILLWLPLEMWIVAYGMCPLLLLLFPTGHLISSRWKPFLWMIGAGILAGVLSAGSEVVAGSYDILTPSLIERLGVLPVLEPLRLVMVASFLVSSGAGVTAIIVRMRRVNSEERQQIKWFIFAAVIFVLIIILEAVFFDQLKLLDPRAVLPADLFWGIPNVFAFMVIPVATAIAILRYRLYDIDFLIRRTLIYTILTVCLALIYFGSVFLLQQAFIFITGETSPVALIISTLTIAALFTPLRRRLQNFIDRRFYRRKYDVARTLDAFNSVVREQVELEKVTALLVSLVDDAMQPECLSLWLMPALSPQLNTGNEPRKIE